MSGDAIEILGLRLLGTHGALPGEQDRPQPFELDLVVEADLSPAAASDELARAVDYGQLVDRAREVVERTRFHLLEALAEAVAGALLADGRVGAVTVALRKLRPPLAADLASVGVRITRRREADGGAR
ncbi:MAG TPA: dihydroneopterin aldolase [Acidimicrobiales bacterium]|nr:dihydroneopterin aldolase [Acidimicrobiales bacterium]